MKEEEKDPFVKSILDGLQLAFKVTANSLYGQTGASISAIYMKQIAASTTATGRELLYFAKDFIENEFAKIANLAISETSNKKKYIKYITNVYKDCPDNKIKGKREDFFNIMYDKLKNLLKGYSVSPEIIYGDSVTGDTPILLKQNDKIVIKTIDSMGDENKDNWESYDNFKSDVKGLTDKQQDNKINYMVWTDKGWSKVNRVIRHKTNKKIYEVLTNTGYVKVTEDHSLLLEDGTEIKPNKCNIGTNILHSFPEIINNEEDNLSKDKSYIYGYFFGNGMINSYKSDNGIKYIWELNKINDKTFCEELKIKLEKLYGKQYKIIDMNSYYKIVPYHGKIKIVYMEYNKFYDKKMYKIIPDEILNGSYNDKLNFFEGYKKSLGYDKNIEYNYSGDIEGQIGIMNMYFLIRSLGYRVEILKIGKMGETGNNLFKLFFELNNNNKDYSIKNINNLGKINDYVYDLETEIGHFHAGIGQLIVKNTDSVFYKPHIKDNNTGEILKDKKALEMSIKMGMLSSDLINSKLPSVMVLNYEKVLYPFVIVSKKRYVGNLYEDNPNKFKQKSMGIVLKRRDNAPIVKIICGAIIDQILNKHSSRGAVQVTKDGLKNMLENKYPIDKFIISKTLKGSYKRRESIAHAILADRIAERDPGNKPESNDRIPYVYFVLPPGKIAKLQGDKIEDPKYVIDNNLRIDYLHYIKNQIMKPSMQFLELIVNNPEDIFNYYIMIEENRRLGKIPINSFNNKKVNTSLDNMMDIESIEHDSSLGVKKKISKTKTITKKQILF